jgi:hypothetical protein
MAEQCKSCSTTIRIPIIDTELCHGEQKIQFNCADHENLAGKLESLSMIWVSVRGREGWRQPTIHTMFSSPGSRPQGESRSDTFAMALRHNFKSTYLVDKVNFPGPSKILQGHIVVENYGTLV